MLVDSTIYDRIWAADTNRFSVSVRGADGNWVDSGADILLDHQVKAAGDKWTDLAVHPLFNKVDESRLSNPTYQAMIKLFDNYVVNYRDPEDFTPAEEGEIGAFLDSILDTQPMQLAFKYITEGLGKPMSKAKFKQELRTIWFELTPTILVTTLLSIVLVSSMYL